MTTTTRAVSTWERLVRFHRIATTEMDDNLRARFGHSLDDYDVLHQMHTHGKPIRMGDLSARLLVANSSCNRIVGRLVDGGFLSRLHDENDRRIVLVQLTPEGRRLRRRMAAAHTRDIEGLVGARLTEGQLLHVDEAIDALLLGTGDGNVLADPDHPVSTKM
jgi:DNA-binding MarR family transcriptional regulator